MDILLNNINYQMEMLLKLQMFPLFIAVMEISVKIIRNQQKLEY